MKRNATAVWKGSGKEGKGHLTTQSNVLNSTQYSWSSRFEEGTGTNPEELIAAAHAGCFTMKMSFLIVAAGCIADELETKCVINLVEGAIIGSHLSLTAKVAGMTEEKLSEIVHDAAMNCPVSKLLNTEITTEFKLNH